jgi:hypothetical protein
MMDNGGPPQDPNTIQIPLVMLQGVQMRIDVMPDGNRILVFGPMALAIHLSPETNAWLNEATKSSPIVIASLADIGNAGV